MKTWLQLVLIIILGLGTPAWAQGANEEEESEATASAAPQSVSETGSKPSVGGSSTVGKSSTAAVPTVTTTSADQSGKGTISPVSPTTTVGNTATPQVSSSATGSGSATPAPVAAGKQPMIVKVNMFVMSISKLDPAIGKFNAEFQIELTPPEGTKDYAGDFEIGNGRILKKEAMEADTENSKLFKVEAEIDFDPDFHRFPWDSQDLSIQIYDPEAKSTQLKYAVAPIDANDSLIDEKVKIAGWHIEESEPTVIEDSYMDQKDKFSSFWFSLTIKRIRLAATMKVFFPLSIMVLISFLALFIGAGAAVNRLTILTGTLLAAVMFHLNASGALPQIGYLTLADKVFFGAYLSFLLNLILTVAIMKSNEQKAEEKVKKIYGTALWLTPLVTAIMWGLAFTGVI
ncbi:MAG: hypothetical protein HQM09_09655 [Candidatus Riflebacteria bacterium]|nr:hypothetical protein [Candidatus Riflebacteria bacterium]